MSRTVEFTPVADDHQTSSTSEHHDGTSREEIPHVDNHDDQNHKDNRGQGRNNGRSNNNRNNNNNNNNGRNNNNNGRNNNNNNRRQQQPPVEGGSEDPRIRDGTLGKVQKKSGNGRNTESFDPRSTLVRPDLRIRFRTADKPLTSDPLDALRHDDVMVVPNFMCDEDDWTLYNQLIREMRSSQQSGIRGSEWISWHEGAHLISKNPKDSPTFQKIVNKITDYFGIENPSSAGTRFNWYRDSADWKPFHHDSAAFNADRAKTQNITIGVSFGVSRELAFLRAGTSDSTQEPTRVYFPQTNGMAFTFGRDVNIQWKHGVNYVDQAQQAEEARVFASKCDEDITVGRISIILWGNCVHVIEEPGSPAMLTDNTRGGGHNMHAGNRNRHGNRQHGGRPQRSDSRNRERSRSRDVYGSRRDDSRDRRRPDNRDYRRDDSRDRRRSDNRDYRRDDSRDRRRPDNRDYNRDDSRNHAPPSDRNYEQHKEAPTFDQTSR